MISRAKAKKTLLDAANLLEDGELGPQWTQRDFVNVDRHGRENYCLVGALRKVVYGTAISIPGWTLDSNVDLMNHICDAIARRLPGADIIGFNDATGRKAEDVIKLLRDTADEYSD